VTPARAADCLVIVVALAAASLGCAGDPGASDTLQLALKTSPNQLDPALVVDVAEGEICAQLFQGLVRFGTDGDIVPDLAKSWEIDGARYLFHLDRRMRFADGRPVDASDVVFSFERVLRPDSRSSRQWVLERIRGARAFTAGEGQSIAGLSATDDSTLIVELDAPFGPFLSLLALPAAMVVPREALTAAPVGANAAGSGFRTFEGLPVGSGRWRLSQWERGDYLLLAPNPHHPVRAQGIDGIRFRIIPEAFTRVAEFESGALDILEIPPAELDRFRGDAGYGERVQRRAELRVYYIGLNNTRPPLDDPRVRRALNHAVDVDRLIEVLTSGTGIRSTGAIPPGLPGYRRRDGYGYDPGLARRLLSQAGYGEGFQMEIWQRESPEGNRILEAVQGYLSGVGVEVRLVRREWSAFKEAVSAGRVDAFFLDWVADYPDSENFIYPLFHSSNAGGGGNRSFFADATVDRLIDEASRTVGETGELYAAIDETVYAQAPWIYLY
jgi:peptide/nickel transport system substrate-binding protein/oligopeptide transport system substrate-binding protein